MSQPETKALVSIGWVLASDERDQFLLKSYDQARKQLHHYLSQQFPRFQWDMPFIKQPVYKPQGGLEPLPLLELGVQEKLNHSPWDFVLVLVSNGLIPHDRTAIMGVPSSALEVAVMSSERLIADDTFSERLAALALHLLGHMWGLDHQDDSPMLPPEGDDTLKLRSFSPSQCEAIIDRLEEVADARLEEQQQQRGLLAFHWHTFWSDPKGILTDIIGYAPWRLPFRMGRLTAAAAVSIVFLLLGAEAWEVGVSFSAINLVWGAMLSIISATLFMFFGQNLSQISRQAGLQEQLTRTRIVLFITLLTGMSALWLVLFVISYFAATVVPAQVPSQWLGQAIDTAALLRYAAFMATLGVLGGALGGNLEEEDELKIRLFYDEET